MRKKREPAPKGALTRNAIAFALTGIQDLRDRVLDNMTSFDHAPEQVITWMFNEDVLDTLRNGYPLINESARSFSRNVEYRISPYTTLMLRINAWEGAKCLAPDPNWYRAHPDQAPLLTYIAAVDETRDRFAVVKHVLEWFQWNATAGALRHYFPAVLSLLPVEYHSEVSNAGGAFREPNNLGPMLPLIREAAVTVANALMIRHDIEKRTEQGLIFRFRSRMLTINGITCDVPLLARHI
jgi:hypothetical protein